MSPEAEKPRIVPPVTVPESKERNHDSKEIEGGGLLPLFVSIRTNSWFSLPPIRGTVTSLLQLFLAPWRFFWFGDFASVLRPYSKMLDARIALDTYSCRRWFEN